MALIQKIKENEDSVFISILILSNFAAVFFHIHVICTRFHQNGYEGFIIISFLTLLIIMLFYSKIRKNAILWLINTGVILLLIYSAWHSTMNYVYLVFYVDLCVGLVLFFDPKNFKSQLIRFSKLSIGLVFLIACIQKIISPHFLSGSFFFHEWFNNAIFATFLTNIGFEQQNILCVDHWHELILGFASGGTTVVVDLPKHSSLLILARTMAILTVIGESLIAISFLLPERYRLTKYRDYFLIMFLIIAYFIVPMFGYGILFVALGFYQTNQIKWTGIIYLCVGLFVLFVSIIRTIQVLEVANQIYKLDGVS